MDFAHDNNESGFTNERDQVWRKSLSIMRDCAIVGRTSLYSPFINFPEMPINSAANESGVVHPFQLMHGVPSMNQQGQIVRLDNTASMEATRVYFDRIKHINDGNKFRILMPTHEHYGLYRNNFSRLEDSNIDTKQLGHNSDDDCENEF